MSRFHPVVAAMALCTEILAPAASASATSNLTSMRPYCSATFAIWLTPDERIDYAKDGPQARYVFYTNGRKLALGDETSGRLPADARVGRSHELPTARVTELRRGGHQIGYVFENAKRGIRTIMLAPDFSGYETDKKLLTRFNFGTERTCATIVPR